MPIATRTDGILLVDKPAGLSSHDAVSIVRRARGNIRAGHAGTLDPFATGLLLVALGRATRLIRFVPSEPKVYEASIVFGTATDTDDATGMEVEQGPAPDERAVAGAILSLTGALNQVPPDYSAKHVDGRRAYALARRGETPSIPAARVVVERWDVTDFSGGQLRATIACSSGTYIRALARDLGRLCGTVAHLGQLRRTRSGPFDVRDATRPDAGADADLLSSASALVGMPTQLVSADEVARLNHGRAIEAHQPLPQKLADGISNQQSARSSVVALLDDAGNLVAIAEREGDWLQPRVVMHDG